MRRLLETITPGKCSHYPYHEFCVYYIFYWAIHLFACCDFCSRFGKFVELQFDQSGRISGAAIRTYLLERSRVCQVSNPERNYHCFYMLCAAPPEVMNLGFLDLHLFYGKSYEPYVLHI